MNWLSTHVERVQVHLSTALSPTSARSSSDLFYHTICCFCSSAISTLNNMQQEVRFDKHTLPRSANLEFMNLHLLFLCPRSFSYSINAKAKVCKQKNNCSVTRNAYAQQRSSVVRLSKYFASSVFLVLSTAMTLIIHREIGANHDVATEQAWVHAWLNPAASCV